MFVQYGGSRASVRPADGVRGTLCKYFGTSEYFFRVYDDDGTFADYDLRHDDLNVTIDIDSFASFYNAGDRGVLDHSPSVLGLKSADETP